MSDVNLPPGFITNMPALAVKPEPPRPLASFADPEIYEQLKKGAATLAKSALVPQSFRDKPEDCFIALHMAYRLNADPMLVMQSLYVVHGTPGWSAKFVIGQANVSNVFRGRIKWREEGAIGGDDHSVTAYATLAETGEEVAETVTMAMAKNEGWTKNKKYQTLPSLMLKYRAATFLVRLHCPEVLMGVPVVDELEDVTAATARPVHESSAEALREVLQSEAAAREEDEHKDQGNLSL